MIASRSFGLLDRTPIDKIVASIPEHARKEVIEALVRDGADGERANECCAAIAEFAAVYVLAGPYISKKARDVRRELSSIAELARKLQSRLNKFSPQAEEQVVRALGPRRRGLFGSGAPEWPALSMPEYLRFQSDLALLAPMLEKAADFRAKQGRPGNPNVRSLCWQANRAWWAATGKAPPMSQVDGAATAPLLRFLRQVVYNATDVEAVREALSDDAFLRTLRFFNRYGGSGPGGILTLADALTEGPRRRRRDRRIQQNTGN